MSLKVTGRNTPAYGLNPIHKLTCQMFGRRFMQQRINTFRFVAKPAGECYASAPNVALGTPVTSDNCGAASVVNNAPPLYPMGTNFVVWTATDIYGNSSSCTQQVIVNQVEANASNITILNIQAIGNNVKLTWQTFGNSTNIIQLAIPTADGSYTDAFTDIATVFVPGSGIIITNWVDSSGVTNQPSRYYRVQFQLGSPCPQ